MSHRDKDPEHAALERGNDWLDGALAGWLVFIAIQQGNSILGDVRGGRAGGTEFVYQVVIALLAIACIIPLLRFHKIGWYAAALVLLFMSVIEGVDLLSKGVGWITDLPFLVIHLAGLGYLLYIRPEFRHETHEHDHDAEPAMASAEADVDAAEAPGEAPASAVPAPRPIPVTMALAAIHHRIVAAGSACALAPAAVRAEAGRFGVTPAMLRNEGLTLYGTFLTFFLSDGPLTADEERELACLERALDLDYTSVQSMRVDAGVVRSINAADATQSAAYTPAAPPPAGEAPADLPPRAEPAPEPVLSDAGSEVGAGTADMADSVDMADSPGAGAVADSVDAADPPYVGNVADSADAADPPYAGNVAESADAADPPDVEDVAESADGAETTYAAAPARSEDALPRFDAPADQPAPQTLGFHPEPHRAADELADYEEHELGALLRWAGVPRPSRSRRAALERLRALHRASTEPLEACASDHPLEPGERCIATRTVELFRLAPGAAPAGAADVPAPVLDPRALVDGTLEAERDLSGYLRAGICRFLLTDRRLLLVAPNGQQSPLPLDRVRSVQPYCNGLDVRPLRGSPVFLAFTGGVEDVAMRLDRAARDLRARPG